MGRLTHQVRFLHDLFCHSLDRINELVQIFFTLGLGGFDHDRGSNDQRKIDGRRMEPVVHKPLDHFQGAHLIWPLELV